MGLQLMNEVAFPVPKHFKDKFPDKPDAWYDKYHMKYLTVLANYTIKPYLTVNGKRARHISPSLPSKNALLSMHR